MSRSGVERGPAFACRGLWFVNLVNFMDGLDWMTVAPRSCRSPVRCSHSDGSVNFPHLQLFSPPRFLGRWLDLLLSTVLSQKSFLETSAAFADRLAALAGVCLQTGLSSAIGCGGAAAAILSVGRDRDAIWQADQDANRFWAAHRSHFYQRANPKMGLPCCAW